jgi:hypothetical protein
MKLLGFALAAAAFVAGYLVAPRATTAGRVSTRTETVESVALLERVSQLEARARALEEENRALRADRGDGPAPAPPLASPAPAVDAADLVERWQTRLREIGSVELLREGAAVLQQTKNYSGVEKVYREYLETVPDGSPEGRLVLMQLGHLHRAEGDYRKSDEAYGRVRTASGPQETEHAEATFQLAWNRRFEEQPEEAARLFADAAGAPGASREIAAISAFSIANLHEDAGRTGQARSVYEAILRDYARDPSGTVRHYVRLAKERLASLE